MDPKKLPDAQLLQQVSKDNRLAFNELFNRYWDDLYRAAFNVLNDNLAAEDAVQEVFVDLWSRRNVLEIENLPGFLHRAVRNQTAKHIRRIKFTIEHQETFDHVLSPLLADENLNLFDLKHQIDFSLEKLPPKCREVFRMSRFENLSNQEIAEIKKLSIRTVETHISNALRHLRFDLKDITFVIITLFNPY